MEQSVQNLPISGDEGNRLVALRVSVTVGPRAKALEAQVQKLRSGVSDFRPRYVLFSSIDEALTNARALDDVACQSAEFVPELSPQDLLLIRQQLEFLVATVEETLPRVVRASSQVRNPDVELAMELGRQSKAFKSYARYFKHLRQVLAQFSLSGGSSQRINTMLEALLSTGKPLPQRDVDRLGQFSS